MVPAAPLGGFLRPFSSNLQNLNPLLTLLSPGCCSRGPGGANGATHARKPNGNGRRAGKATSPQFASAALSLSRCGEGVERGEGAGVPSDGVGCCSRNGTLASVRATCSAEIVRAELGK